VRDVSLYFSNHSNPEIVATLDELSNKVEETVRARIKLEVHAKYVINYVCYLYEQLELELQGVKQGKYPAEELKNRRDNLRKEVDNGLAKLMNMILAASKKAEDADEAAGIVVKLILKGLRFEIEQLHWGPFVWSMLSANSLSNPRQRQIDEYLDLMNKSITAVQETRTGLSYFRVPYLAGFWEAAENARMSNDSPRDGTAGLGLDAEDLLKLYQEILVRARKEIDGRILMKVL